MTNVTVRTSDVAGFFLRAKDAAHRADEGAKFEDKITLSFEDPQEMFNLLTAARHHLMLEVISEAKSISELTHFLHRKRWDVIKDISLLEKAELIVSQRKSNPRRGVIKVVKSVGEKIEMVATLG